MPVINEEVDRLATSARELGRLGLDTEFMPEGRYRPLLCLVQIVVGEYVQVLDPLVDDFDPTPLAEVLADPAIEIVLHAGRQDVAILRREWKTTFTNVFDTQVAAGFAGFSAQAGYNGLLHDVLRIRLPKTASFTRWDARPLTDEQIKYARGDVEHLLPLADDIQRRLIDRERLEWAREECHAIAEATDERDADEVWRRLPRVSGLDPKERAVAQALAGWRERTAAAEDRPVGAILRDPDRRRAGQAPARRAARPRPDPRHHARRRAPPRRRRGGGDRARPARRADPPGGERPLPDRGGRRPDDRARRVARARPRAGGGARLRADRRPRRPLTRWSSPPAAATREPDVRTLQGWRRELVGAELLELLAGRRTLSVGQGGRVQVTEVDGRDRVSGGFDQLGGVAEPGGVAPGHDQPVDERADEEVGREVGVRVGADLAADLGARDELLDHAPARLDQVLR